MQRPQTLLRIRGDVVVSNSTSAKVSYPDISRASSQDDMVTFFEKSLPELDNMFSNLLDGLISAQNAFLENVMSVQQDPTSAIQIATNHPVEYVN